MIKLNDNEINIGNFPDGTMLIKQNIPDADKFTVSWLYGDDKEMIALIYLVNHLKAYGKENIHLYMPYIPNARQDKMIKDYTLDEIRQRLNGGEF